MGMSESVANTSAPYLSNPMSSVSHNKKNLYKILRSEFLEIKK
jgi:hypothetical protein